MKRDRIEVEALSKSYGASRSLADVSFAVPAGQILGLVGASGAGKSTLLRLLAGLAPPGAGCVRLNGHDLARERERATESLSALVEIYPEPVPSEVGLRWECLIHGRPVPKAPQGGTAPAPHGIRRRAVLDHVLSSRASIFLLDEATVGFDPQTAAATGDRIRQLARQGATVVLATSDPGLAHTLCDRIALLEAGRLTLDLPVHRSPGLSTPAVYRIRVGGCLDDRWATWFDSLEIERGAEQTVISGPMVDQSALHTVLARVRDMGLPLISVEWVPSELERIEECLIRSISNALGSASSRARWMTWPAKTCERP